MFQYTSIYYICKVETFHKRICIIIIAQCPWCSLCLHSQTTTLYCAERFCFSNPVEINCSFLGYRGNKFQSNICTHRRKNSNINVFFSSNPTNIALFYFFSQSSTSDCYVSPVGCSFKANESSF